MLSTIANYPTLPTNWHLAVFQMQAKSASKKDCTHSEMRGFSYIPGNAITVGKASGSNRIVSLGWSHIEALETRLRFQTFEDDWNYPGMEVYDEL